MCQSSLDGHGCASNPCQCKSNYCYDYGETVEEDVKNESVSDGEKFETQWEEVNWKWTRIMGYLVPVAADYRFGV